MSGLSRRGLRALAAALAILPGGHVGLLILLDGTMFGTAGALKLNWQLQIKPSPESSEPLLQPAPNQVQMDLADDHGNRTRGKRKPKIQCLKNYY